jgi:beta-N-acetylhexosaminidase
LVTAKEFQVPIRLKWENMRAHLRCAAILLVFMLSIGTAFATEGADTVDAQIDALSDEQKVAQLLIVGVSGAVDSAALRRSVKEWGVGGVVLYARNIESSAQVQRLTAAIADHADGAVTPFIAVDQEGGIVKRLRFDVPILPSAMAISATRSPELARRAGAAVGTALRQLGFTMNFAPVLDVLSVSENPSIGTRAFGSDAALVAMMGSAFVVGQDSAGIISVGKHFPGLGGVREDTHKALPRLDATLEVLRHRDLVPFREAIAKDLKAIMTGHIALPQITERADLPATLSRRVATNLLRDELGFNGILITDALQMDALPHKDDVASLALDALLAGSDMVITVGTSDEREQVFHGLRAAYQDGRLPKARVRQALRRILEVKASLQQRQPATESRDGIVEEIAARAITRFTQGSPEIPAVADLERQLLYVGLQGPLQSRIPASRSILLAPRIDEKTSSRLVISTAAAMKRAPLCIASATTQDQFEVIRRAHEASPGTPLIFVNLGSPHRLIAGPRSLTLLTYGDDSISQLAAARVVLGEAIPGGVLPVR